MNVQTSRTTQRRPDRRATTRTGSTASSDSGPSPAPERSHARRILQVNTADLAGGAARAAYRLHTALRDAGEESRLFVLRKESRGNDVVMFSPRPGALSRIRRLARKERLRREFNREARERPPHLEHFRDDRTEFAAEPLGQFPEADILHMHWIAEFIDYREVLPQAILRAPLVWTLHDMNVFTGGCHYDLGCGRYRDACGACPQLGSRNENDLSRRIHRRKDRCFRRLSSDRVRIVAGSEWIASAARESSLSRFPVSVIHCGIDPAVFRPRDRDAMRRALEIPLDSFVILFAADHIENDRKGLSLLLNAIENLPQSPLVRLVTVGHGTPTFRTSSRHIHLGNFSTDEMLSLYYSCGDCFVIPSRQEAFGLTALEAMACGTPAIGFDTGGIPDLIEHGETGMLARPGDAGDLSRTIRWLMEHPAELRAMRVNARERVSTCFTVQRQASMYQDLYDELLATASPLSTR